MPLKTAIPLETKVKNVLNLHNATTPTLRIHNPQHRPRFQKRSATLTHAHIDDPLPRLLNAIDALDRDPIGLLDDDARLEGVDGAVERVGGAAEFLDLARGDDGGGGEPDPAGWGAGGGEEDVEGGDTAGGGGGGVVVRGVFLFLLLLLYFLRDGHGGDVGGEVGHAAGAEGLGGGADGAAGVVLVEDVGGGGVQAAGDGNGEGVGEDEGVGGRGGGGRHAEGGRFRGRDRRRQKDAVGRIPTGEERAGRRVDVGRHDHQGDVVWDVLQEARELLGATGEGKEEEGIVLWGTSG